MKRESFNTKRAVLIGDSGPTSDGSTKTQTKLRCAKKFQLAYVRRVQVPKSVNPSYFSVGSIFGAVRAAWFGIKFQTSAKAWTFLKHAAQKEAEKSRLPIALKDETYGLALFEQYAEYWSQRPLPKPVATEFKLDPHPSLQRTGSLDDLSYYPEAGDGALCAGECKTTSGDIASVVREYEFHVQTLQYQALYLLMKPKFGPLAGHVFDVTHKPEGKGKKPSFARVFVKFEEQALRTFIASTQVSIREEKAITWDTDTVRSYQCTYQAGRARVDCEYKALCQRGRSAAARFVLADGSRLLDYKPKEGARSMPWV